MSSGDRLIDGGQLGEDRGRPGPAAAAEGHSMNGPGPEALRTAWASPML